ncbi:bacteriophage transcriptional activator [Streptococcus pneumoniae]|uniref:Bacteriophage transcriptional activator n=1 Tax=Streptococcus pneumoniae TaxID=1313 RepID=A0A4J1SDW3_STREE|nr:hypothetical protein [Streptococcus pneumoniae]VIP42889.1 bacteriophage transcriptional activator [Streptococcus pneumoniae]VIP51031.1 bacteriophage transcriptional activator [Streptococcus pneumoniae]VIP64197.1 bacteriophage transcriptional activator [Streptococcus pneumoniae]VIQ04933.1 bacteriophage transcriptional activator [Streptococcus pneumoniae]VIQ83107.1 bacteriophage transcriptional activator [Streptococcus pneumoniae]
MNKRIKKKIAKRQIQEKQEELYKQLRKLSSEEIEAITKMINQAVSNIRKAFSQIFDNLFTFLKNLEVEIEKIERRRTQNVRQRTFQISKHSTHNRLKKARIRNQDAQSGPTVGISKPTETIAIRIADDPTLKFLEGFKGIINKLLSNLVEEDKEIFNLRWRYPQLRWEEIAEQKFMSKATIYRRRRIILEQYAIMKGEL